MKILFLFILITSSFFSFAQNNQEKMKPADTEVWEPKVPVVIPGKNNGPPSDAIVLFNGEDLNQWVKAKDLTDADWHLNKDGSMTVKNKAGDIKTKQIFGSVQLHIEWKSSTDNQADDQHRGNSGVFLQSRYEVQVLDNNYNDTYVNGQVASIYKQSIPLVNASVATGDWNFYDIIYHQPEFDENGSVLKKATITVLHNGILVQDHFIIQGETVYIGHPKYQKHGKAPILLQDHGDNSRVSYRNIWVRALD
jgi:archaellum component FlaF (FlaF/FlaG flagellin family)